MTVKPGDILPDIALKTLNEGLQTHHASTLLAGQKVVLFGVPGAFTPTCSARHLPGYIEHLEQFTERGVQVFCIAVNDPFVMQAWGREQNVPAALQLVSDGNAELTRHWGLELDASASGMGIRCKRFAMYIENRQIKRVAIEQPGQFEVSSAEAMLAAIDAL